MSIITKVNLGPDGKAHIAGSAEKHVAVLFPQIGWMVTATPFNTEKLQHRELVKEAKKVTLFGAKDWILPDIELLKLCPDHTRRGPAFDPAHFYGIPDLAWIWSSTELAGAPAYAWNVDTRFGFVYGGLRDNRGFGLAARFVGQ